MLHNQKHAPTCVHLFRFVGVLKSPLNT